MADSNTQADSFKLIESIYNSETPLVSRLSILDCGKSIKEEVFHHFDVTSAVVSKSVKASSSGDRSSTGSFRCIGTPIIIVPNSMSALINMYNAEKFLSEGIWVSPVEAKSLLQTPKPEKITITKRLKCGQETKFYIVDDPTSLKDHEWQKIVSIFVVGESWQFKDWKKYMKEVVKRDGSKVISPVELLTHYPGFILKYENEGLPKDALDWSLTPLNIYKHHRHFDKSVSELFWDAVEKDMVQRKRYLLPDGGASLA